MTASLPVPNDIDPEEPDRHSSARVVRISDSVSQPSEKPRRPARASRQGGKSAPRKKRAAAAPVDPGPPPPLPSDLEIAASVAAAIVVPPRPPLPAEPRADAGDGAAAEVPDTDTPAAEAPAAEAQPAPEVAERVPTVAEPAPEVAERVPAVAEPAPEVAEPVEAPEPVAVAEPAPVVAPAPPAPPVAEPVSVPPAEAEPEAAADPAETASLPESIVVPTLAAAAGDALVLRGVTKRFGSTHAVDGIDLTVPAGTFYGLVGPNGAGKTTTLSMIAGLLEPDRGTIHVAGVDAAAHPLAAKKLMGVLPDRLRTFDRLTGRQLLYYYGVLRGLPPAVVESRTADLARAFDLQDALGRSVSDYSAGMLKKVMLAGALIHSPRVLVLDEPFEAVDPVSSAIILDILSAYVAHGGTVILSSHGMELVERVCTRVAVIVAGQVLAEGTVDEVRGELTLEQRFVELAGGLSDVEGLEWLHTFSG
ncbi:ABC transporter ATP-binding protein [Microbacterium sp. NPDC058389]|uniref:ABC transporter ATP-binding protein n=1 Tax=Microbacterium sp. NPDC058389 TaxID=3346475 RepID=UPI003654B021